MKSKMFDLLWEHRSIFALSRHELGECSASNHTIELSSYEPIKGKYRRIPPSMFQAVKDEIEKLADSGVIVPSYSPWSSPISIAIKKDGSPRLCLDFRKINSITKKDAQPVPNVTELMDHLYGKRIFSSLDLIQGYHQIKLSEDCQELTAFNAGPLGFWQFTRMPFGLTNAGATFQRTMEYILRDLLSSICLVYIDDIIVHSITEQDHLKNLETVFKRLNQYNMRLKPSKCVFLKQELRFLGHTITDRGICKDPSKIQDILNWEPPTTVRQVRQFIGLAGFLRKFLKNYALIAQPITDLLKGYSNTKSKKYVNKKIEKEKFYWGSDQDIAFQRLRKVISEYVMLAYADSDKPFRVSVYASRTGLGTCLEQQQPDDTYRPAAFASRRTSDIEKNYATRWVASLEPFDFKVIYRPGSDNVIADALSRKYEADDTEDIKRYQEWAKSKCHGFPEESTDISLHEQPIAAISITDTLGKAPNTDDYDWHSMQVSDATIYTIIQIVQDESEDCYDTLTSKERVLLRYADKLHIVDGILCLKENNINRIVLTDNQQF